MFYYVPSFLSEEDRVYDVDALARNTSMEKLGKGRFGVMFGREGPDGLMPLVRSTTVFHNPTLPFQPFHETLAGKLSATIMERTNVPLLPFNNVLMEAYTNEYRQMGYHSDMALDLHSESWICIVTMYKSGMNVDPSSRRVLRIKEKGFEVEQDIILEHGSVVLFNMETNRKYLHKIVLEDPKSTEMWMGLTFRTSKRHVHFSPQYGTPTVILPGSLRFDLADECEKSRFFKMRSMENRSTEFVYPETIGYTVSPGDRLHYRKFLKMETEISNTRMMMYVLEPHGTMSQLNSIMEHFPGRVYKMPDPWPAHVPSSTTRVYLVGDVQKILSRFAISHGIDTLVTIVKEFSYNYEDVNFEDLGFDHDIVTIPEVPINIYNIGVLYQNLFPESSDSIFERVCREHQFQTLTESNKVGTALRTGLYITEVKEQGDDVFDFRLLRCSSNFTGPTENFGPTDRMILEKINKEAKYVFHTSDGSSHRTHFNHVLAQIYHNNQKNGKAKIKEHTDKTEDMPAFYGIAFCTFYDPHSWHPNVKPGKANPYDMCYNGNPSSSALTKLVFRLKNKDTPGYEPEVSVTLYPNSVFIISQKTNRLYTHEIRPSILQADQIPTRLGYVVRCSKADAIFKDGQTFLKEDGLIPLARPTSDDVQHLRNLYFQENTTDSRVTYGRIHFSMNEGDYMQPKM